jgi:Transposase IS116/IS110/IS902 family./Transposase.
MHYKENYLYIGIDPHKDFHVAVILDIWGNWRKKLAVIKLHNRPSAFPGFLEQVKSYAGKGETLLFGLEDAHNYGRSLAAFLHDNQQPVKEVNSALTTMQRKSNPSIHKDDAWDAFCAAEILRSRLDELPDIKPDDYHWTIRQLVTRRYGLVKSFGTAKNQLHVQLALSYPSYTKMFGVVDGMAALKFWDKYPSPKALEGVTAEELDKFLRDSCRNKRAINGKAEKILSLVQSDGDTTRDHQERRDFLVRNIVKEMWHKQGLIAELEKELREVLKLMDLKLETMPGISTVTAAALVAEIGDINRFSSADKLARYAGCAPVSFSSGKR